MSNNDTIDALKSKLKSATKLKLSRERELFKSRDAERSLNEELAVVKIENEFLEGQLQDLKTEIGQARHQIAMIGICSASEKAKIETHFKNLESHRKGFQEIFDNERAQQEFRIKEFQEKEAAEEELIKQRERDRAEKIEQENREVAALEAECDGLQQDCVVLKKRNNAIMLQLRRKLLETERTRRQLMKKNTDLSVNLE